MATEDADTGIDFTKTWANSDIVFATDTGQVYANRAILCMWSPVMEAMFTLDFKEKDATEIPLPGKTLEIMVELMKVVHPPNKEIDDTNVVQLLPLTQEYQMGHMTKRCEQYLLTQPPSVTFLVLADRYHLQLLKSACIQYVKDTPLSQLKQHEDFNKIEPKTLNEVLTSKVQRFESRMLLIQALVTQKNPAEDEWCPSNESFYQHALGSSMDCLHCNSYNFKHIEEICKA